jgi:hypothetical protein
MTQKEKFQIIYDGEALQTHEMDIRDLAPALLAIGDLMEEANKIVYGDLATVNVNVKGSFKTGCFQVDLTLVQSLASQLSTLLTSENAVAVTQILSITGFNAMNCFGLLPLIKWVKNRPIKKITKLGNGKSTVEIDDEHKEVEDKVIDLYRNLRARKAVETIIFQPLQKKGIDEFAVKHDKSIVKVVESEKEYFKSPEPEDTLVDENTIETVLQAVTVSFAEGNKWKFTDGNVQFYATIMDESFISKVQTNLAKFAKDDILRVKLHKKSYISGGFLKTDYEITEVIKHESVGKQIALPFEKDEKKAA